MRAEQDDIAIIKSVLDGHKSAYSVLVGRYQSYVFTIVLRHINNREQAEELAQDVFVKAYRFLADFRGTSKFSTWLYTIAHTTCLSYLRTKKDNAILLDEDKMVSVADGAASYSPTTQSDKRSQQILIGNAMKHLPPADAELLTLFYLAEQSVEEISIILGLSAPNVKVRLFRARQKMKEILETKFKKELI